LDPRVAAGVLFRCWPLAASGVDAFLLSHRSRDLGAFGGQSLATFGQTRAAAAARSVGGIRGGDGGVDEGGRPDG